MNAPPSNDSFAAQRLQICRIQQQPEASVLEALLAQLPRDPGHDTATRTLARELAQHARGHLGDAPGLDHFVREYDLRSEEGVLLMCLAEALLRIPDDATRNQLVGEVLAHGHWDRHLGHSDSLLVNASTWGLFLGGEYLDAALSGDAAPQQLLHSMTQRLGTPLARAAMVRAVSLLADHFVMGADIQSALARARRTPAQSYSFDCLGEAAQHAQDVERYFSAYADAIDAIASSGQPTDGPPHSLSIKLSALHPRYHSFQHARILHELYPRLRELVQLAQAKQLALTLDAEECDRLEVSLDIFQQLWDDDRVAPGIGLAVQAYQTRALPVLQWLQALAQSRGVRIPVRLVKGAYWDSEIKTAQQAGLAYYPVFTRKAATDVSYLACAHFLLRYPAQFYPRFASHNAHSIAAILQSAPHESDFEFQRLHGMGDAIYAALAALHPHAPPCRIYAPVGQHRTLLPYLVRRLLENGANSSFINQLGDPAVSLELLSADPRHMLAQPAPAIPLAGDIYQPQRRNAAGVDLHDPAVLDDILPRLQSEYARHWQVAPLLNGEPCPGTPQPLHNPADLSDQPGEVQLASAAQVDQAFEICRQHLDDWQRRPASERAARLDDCAAQFEQHRVALMARIVREAGRTLPDALAEVREAVDFCRYYAALARQQFGQEAMLPGVTGEQNQLQLTGRGTFACISPWNFPLAIFTGQICAALAAGNAVVAKPASATPATAMLAIELMLHAGIPAGVLQFVPGESRAVGPAMLANAALSGVAFTGAFETAQQINRALALRDGAIVPLIAETGGINVMFADSSALTEQLVPDVLQSAFNSAGQRCSALRVLLLQQDIADATLQRLYGALDEWRVGDPRELATDTGPLISAEARRRLGDYCDAMRGDSRQLYRHPARMADLNGHFLAPQVFSIEAISELRGEVFGPILHVMRYRKQDFTSLVEAVNNLGYGLTMGLHSRLRATREVLQQHARVGNLYINRNMIGATVGSQPFGGEGRSGTGPKAGGPHYLLRFAHERSTCLNSSAFGGNPELLNRPTGKTPD